MSAFFLPPLRAASSWSWLTLGVASVAFWGSVLLLPASPAQQADEIDVFATLIAPILEQRCISCHDADDPEAGLRLDSYEELMFGSELGPVVVAKRPEASALIQVLHLPKEHERHMPPKRKPQPSEDEIAVLSWWIRAGGSKERRSESTLVARSRALALGFRSTSGQAGAGDSIGRASRTR